LTPATVEAAEKALSRWASEVSSAEGRILVTTPTADDAERRALVERLLQALCR
jgi:hypothetical protein